MDTEMCEIRCETLAELEQQFPEEMSVVREMLAESGEECSEGLAA